MTRRSRVQHCLFDAGFPPYCLDPFRRVGVPRDHFWQHAEPIVCGYPRATLDAALSIAARVPLIG